MRHSLKAGAAHIAFSAPSRTAVRDFYAAALNAGGRSHGSPAVRNEENGYYNAAVLDFDGNSVEVVCRDEQPRPGLTKVVQRSGVLTWRESVTERLRDGGSAIEGSTVRSVAKTARLSGPAAPRSIAPSSVSRAYAPSVTRSVSEPVITAPKPTASVRTDNPAKTVVGTLIGAAAGAALVYAMCKSEEDSGKAEAEAFDMSQAQENAKSLVRTLKAGVDFLAERTGSVPGAPDAYRDVNLSSAPRAIEAAPAMSYHSPTYSTVPPSMVSRQQAIEWNPTSEHGFETRSQAHRSFSLPAGMQDFQHAISSPDTRSTSHSYRHRETGAPSEISRALPHAPERRSSANSVISHHTSKSRKSSHTDATIRARDSRAPSAYSSRTHSRSHCSRSSSQPPFPLPAHASRTPSAAGIPVPASIVGSTTMGAVLGRSVMDHPSDDDNDDKGTITPSDSISCAGHSERSRRSSKSSKSKHSKHSRRSSKVDSARSDKGSKAPSEASTVKPVRRSSGHVGSAVSLPVRGITPSMIKGQAGKRSVFSFAMGE